MALFDQLMDAIRNKNNEDVSELLGRLDVQTVNGMDRNGNTPLLFACEYNNNHAVTALLAIEGIQVNGKNSYGYSPLHMACDNNNSYAVTALLDMDGIQVNGTDIDGYSPLHRACIRNNSHAVAALLAMDGIQVNRRRNYGNTPIMKAAWNSSVEALRLMVEDPRVDIDVRDGNGELLEELVGYGPLSEERNKNTCIEILREERRKRENTGMRQNMNEESLEETFREMHLDPLSEARLESLKEKHDLEKKTLDLESNQGIMKIEIQKSLLEQQLAVLQQSLDEMKQLKKTNEKEMKKKHDDELVTLTNNLKKQRREFEVENDDSSNLKDARETLECPVCMDPMKPPTRIWMCPASHLICDQCRNKLDGRQCPTCRTKKVNLRAFMAEKFAQTVFNKYSSKI